MRDIKEQLDSYQDHLDSLYPAVTAEDIHDIDLDARHPSSRTGTPLRLRVVALVAAFALTLGLGALVFLVRGSTDVVPAGDVQPMISSTVPSLTTAPSVTTAPSSVTTTVPLTTTVDGVIELTGDSAGADVIAAIDPEGRLVVAYWSVDD